MNINNLKFKFLIQSLFFPISIILLTVMISGHINYWQGWTYNVLNCVFVIIAFVALSNNKDLIAERLKPSGQIKKFDKVYLILEYPARYSTIIVSIIDANYFGFAAKVTFSIVVFGIVLYVLSQSMFIWAMKVNSFFSTIVCTQLERKHRVCKEGPYKFIRHPGYFGGILFAIATPLVLGSFLGLIPTGITIILILMRTYLEDVTLQKELQGYYEYTKEVRSRLIPGIW